MGSIKIDFALDLIIRVSVGGVIGDAIGDGIWSMVIYHLRSKEDDINFLCDFHVAL